MDLGIRGRKALLVGASRGLGRACALAVAREGVNVTIVARTRDVLERTAAEIRDATGVEVTPVAADITTEDGRAAALKACPEPDILLNNADGPMPRKFGRIVNISSRSVKIPQLELGLSNSARTGLIGFVAGLARQTVMHNVTINNLLPGIFDSDAQKRHIEGMLDELGESFDQVWRERAAGSPAKRYGDPAEFGSYFAYLCSAQAGYITGQNLLIDGGSYPGTF